MKLATTTTTLTTTSTTNTTSTTTIGTSTTSTTRRNLQNTTNTSVTTSNMQTSASKLTTTTVNASTTQFTLQTTEDLSATYFIFYQTASFNNINDLAVILSNYKYDLNGCLVNCSNKGQCMYNVISNRFVCDCNSNYKGLACQTNVKPCFSNPCLNNGVCFDNYTTNFTAANTTEFYCQCQNNNYGFYCENAIDVCKNRNCSNNGYCTVNGTNAQCKCYINYNGDDCQYENSFIKMIRYITMSTLFIALGCLGFTVSLVILNDVWSFLIHSPNKVPIGKIRTYDSKPIQFKYQHYKTFEPSD